MRTAVYQRPERWHKRKKGPRLSGSFEPGRDPASQGERPKPAAARTSNPRIAIGAQNVTRYPKEKGITPAEGGRSRSLSPLKRPARLTLAPAEYKSDDNSPCDYQRKSATKSEDTENRFSVEDDFHYFPRLPFPSPRGPPGGRCAIFTSCGRHTPRRPQSTPRPKWLHRWREI